MKTIAAAPSQITNAQYNECLKCSLCPDRNEPGVQPICNSEQPKHNRDTSGTHGDIVLTPRRSATSVPYARYKRDIVGV